jgi:hypothetical protein
MDYCTYCSRPFSKEELKILPLEDSPQLDRKYCPRCYPEVYTNHLNLPWIKKKLRNKE